MLCEVQRTGSYGLDSCCSYGSHQGKVPFINFFDGFRTSHEIQKIETWDYEDLKDMVDHGCIAAIPQAC